MSYFTGGTLALNIFKEKHTELQGEPAHWTSWRSLLLVTSREEAEGQRGGTKNSESMRWSIWSTADTLLTELPHLSIITVTKMRLRTSATAKSNPGGSRKTDMTSAHYLHPKRGGTRQIGSALSHLLPQQVHLQLLLKRRTMMLPSSTACWSVKLSYEGLPRGGLGPGVMKIQTHPRRAAWKRAAGNPVGTAVAHLVTGPTQICCLLTRRQSE